MDRFFEGSRRGGRQSSSDHRSPRSLLVTRREGVDPQDLCRHRFHWVFLEEELVEAGEHGKCPGHQGRRAWNICRAAASRSGSPPTSSVEP